MVGRERAVRRRENRLVVFFEDELSQLHFLPSHFRPQIMSSTSYQITAVPGDGIGPLITAQSVPSLACLTRQADISLNTPPSAFGIPEECSAESEDHGELVVGAAGRWGRRWELIEDGDCVGTNSGRELVKAASAPPEYRPDSPAHCANPCHLRRTGGYRPGCSRPRDPLRPH